MDAPEIQGLWFRRGAHMIHLEHAGLPGSWRARVRRLSDGEVVLERSMLSLVAARWSHHGEIRWRWSMRGSDLVSTLEHPKTGARLLEVWTPEWENVVSRILPAR